MAPGDGNGWVECPFGHRHWGLFGAAGLLLIRRLTEPEVLLQLRAGWTHEGGRWGLPGGARDSHETITQAALREAAEEAGVQASQVTVLTTVLGADHVNWTYTYAIALARHGLRVGPPNEESDELAWVGLSRVTGLPLHSGLASTWESLQPDIWSALRTATTG